MPDEDKTAFVEGYLHGSHKAMEIKNAEIQELEDSLDIICAEDLECYMDDSDRCQVHTGDDEK